MKVCVLIPVYMADNCREINKANLLKLKETEFKYVDEVIICDQCFEPDDYIEGFTYLGPFQQLPNRVSDARNILFKYFYNSDYDYAVLMDARESLSKSGLNSFVSLMNAIHNDLISCDFIQGTLGVHIMSERIADKKREDYKETVFLRKMKAVRWDLHHTVISNHKKKYGFELSLPAERMGGATGNRDRVPEDMFFTKLCNLYFDIFLIADMTVNTGSQLASTWAPTGEVPSAIYAKEADSMVLEYYNPSYVKKGKSISFMIPRVEDYKSLLGDYKPRIRKDKVVVDDKVTLFD